MHHQTNSRSVIRGFAFMFDLVVLTCPFLFQKPMNWQNGPVFWRHYWSESRLFYMVVCGTSWQEKGFWWTMFPFADLFAPLIHFLAERKMELIIWMHFFAKILFWKGFRYHRDTGWNLDSAIPGSSGLQFPAVTVCPMSPYGNDEFHFPLSQKMD